MQGEMAQTPSKIFRQLNDADLKFGFVTDAKGEAVELTNSTSASCSFHPTAACGRTAFHQYYEQFLAARQNTLAATLAGSIHTDVYYSKARGLRVGVGRGLFSDKYRKLSTTICISNRARTNCRRYRYLEVRRQKMKLADLTSYDTYVPILADMEQSRSWDEAVQTVIDSLSPGRGLLSHAVGGTE